MSSSTMPDLATQLTYLVVREAASNSTSDSSGDDTTGQCSAGNDYDGKLGVRISAIFVILVGSFLGEHLYSPLLLRSGCD